MIKDMYIKDLKNIINELPDDMLVIMPVVAEEKVNHILGFRKVRTAGILVCDGEEERKALCLNGSADGQDIADQVHFSGKDVDTTKVLFGNKEK